MYYNRYPIDIMATLLFKMHTQTALILCVHVAKGIDYMSALLKFMNKCHVQTCSQL